MMQMLTGLEGQGVPRAAALSALAAGGPLTERLKRLLGIEGEEQDDLIAFTLQCVMDLVLSYLNRRDLPFELERVALCMAVSYWRAAGFGAEQSSVGEAGPIASVKRGDVTVSYAAGGSSSGGSEAKAGAFGLADDNADGFFGWRTVLNPYRMLRW